MKKFFIATAALGALALTGCAATEEAAPVTTTVEATTTTTTTPTVTVEPTESPEPTETETHAEPEPVYVEPEPVYAEPTTATAVEPYVVECGTGTPGPALMSDGTYVHSDYCFEVMGGEAYLAEESWANSPDNPALAAHYAEQNHRSPTYSNAPIETWDPAVDAPYSGPAIDEGVCVALYCD